MVYKHGGNLREIAGKVGRDETDICDFSANINPLGVPKWLRAVISRTVDSVVNYPDTNCRELVAAIAGRYGIGAEQVIVGNGSSEIIHAIPRALGRDKALIVVPSYFDYTACAELSGMQIETFNVDADSLELDVDGLSRCIHGGEIVFVATPNNPTGLMFDAEVLRVLAREHAETIFVVDEAFIDFVAGADSLICNRPGNVIVLRSMTKFYAIPGIRLGFAVADEAIAGKIREFITPWSVNAFAQACGVRAISDSDYANETVELIDHNRGQLYDDISKIDGLCAYPGRANFLLIKILAGSVSAGSLAEKLLEKDGIAIRLCENFDGLDESFFRVAVKAERENQRLCDGLRREFGMQVTQTKIKITPSIMFQGCSSSAGKSYLTAALCRVLLQDGVRVAPFKSQNMSLNSFVTRDGCEMGRAQAVQAQACKLDPDVRMNPVLLKPNSDTGSQVIVMGKPVGNMKVAEYTAYKPRAFEAVKGAYESLCNENDAIVIEGAGSPAEINLKADDIVNMKMARYAESPVLLVGDIDRGGVYASFVGSMELMEQWERQLVAGFIVNRFRGDQTLLDSAHTYLLEHTAKPVLGVVPYITEVSIPEEDSVQFKATGFNTSASAGDAVNIVVVDLAHISNFTDFEPFTVEPDVNLRAAKTAEDIITADAVIIPGSKNVIADIAKLKDSGIADAIKSLAANGTAEIVGICAGFQMLGKTIKDPNCVESDKGATDGLGLLPVTTVMAKQKTLQLAKAVHLESGLEIGGYEIHHGQTDIGTTTPAVKRDDGTVIGGNI